MKVTLLHGAMVAALSVSYQAQAYNCQSLPDWDSTATYTSGTLVKTQEPLTRQRIGRKAMTLLPIQGLGRHGKR